VFNKLVMAAIVS